MLRLDGNLEDKNLDRTTSVGDFVIVMIVMLSMIGKCINGENGEYEGVGGEARMVKTEQEALYFAIQG
ncbi:hypothetical protein L6452_28445 [Arctium lappa]|uniref:Uncharacterized protein n=1 Tax=Arctium lappa TaxID=4217 RepID=A0ACB8ZYG3_ARCLA|nr:hypothetical protein L6452_28445 [Arctium lappa]